MGQAAAKKNDLMTATDMHSVTVDGSATPQSLPHSFNGRLSTNLSSNVYVNGQAAAVKGSEAMNRPGHTPTAPGTAFVNPPSNRGVVTSGSGTVFVNGRSAARSGDSVRTCADPAANTSGRLSASGDVYIGG